jgi:hypothetical protein
MNVAADSQAHLKVVDSTGTTHYVECLRCALKLLKNCSEITITANCDWNGPNYAITINLKNDGNITNVNPPTALFIDGGCTKNRVVYNQAAADALLAHNGSSTYLTMMQNTTIPSNATVLTIAKAAAMYGFIASPDPTPTPTPTASPSPTPIQSPTATPSYTIQPTASPTIAPTKTPAPTATPSPEPVTAQVCEACGMEVNPEAQAKYVIVDGNGTKHYAECFMCALNLINDYDQLTITTYCDWYGPNYPVTVQSSQFGKEVNVSPSNAMFLNGGSCVINRVAYNQTAADELLRNGFSMYTLQAQHYDLPSETKVSTIVVAATNTGQKDTPQSPIPLLTIGAIAGVAIIALSIIAYKKLNLSIIK